MDKSSTLLANYIEPYRRSKAADAHHERRIGTAMNTSSFPKKQGNYGWISTITTYEDNSTKLKIGATVSNLLSASSVRIDKNAMTKSIMELGSTTSNFTPTNDTKIYLHMESLRLEIFLAEDSSIANIDAGDYFYQLGQLRSKFYCLSTYTSCRSSSTFAFDISYRPYTIWTLCKIEL